MLGKLRPRSIYDLMAAIACVAALAGGTAYAANEWTGENIVDGSLTGQDIFNNTLAGGDITNGSVTGADIFDNTIGSGDITNSSLTGGDVANTSSLGPDDIHEEILAFNNTIVSSDIASGGVQSVDVADNSLTGADINESTLNMPPTTTATFAGPPDRVFLDSGGSLTQVASKSLPPGSYAVVATANTTINNAGDILRDVVCELRASLSTGGSAFIGGATDRRLTPDNQQTKATLSMNGGAQIGAGGGSVQLWCRVQPTITVTVDYAQIMIIRLDGFF
jgi:hypothetical protein